MSVPPTHPKIYHITHVDNFPSIIGDGGLVSDAEMIARGGPATAIGMSAIKQRRLGLPVGCHPGDCVGDYVPFYFCPRSIMLYVIHCANHPDLAYHGGQDPIIHLEADLREVVEWADELGRPWAFSHSNAGAVYAQFRASLAQLNELDWSAIAAIDWRSSGVKEAKQAEFLLRDSFPYELIRRVGVRNTTTLETVVNAVSVSLHQPHVEIRTEWYY